MSRVLHALACVVLAADVAAQDLSTLRSMLEYVADDARHGRALGGTGLGDVQRIIERRFSALGLAFAGDATNFRQEVPLFRVEPDTARMLLRREPAPQPWDRYSVRSTMTVVPLVDWILMPQFGRPSTVVVIPDSANLLVGGRFGARNAATPEAAKGKVVIFHPPLRPDGSEDYQLAAYRDAIARYSDASALLFTSLELIPGTVQRRWAGARVELGAERRTNNRLPPVLAISENSALHHLLIGQLRPEPLEYMRRLGPRNYAVTIAYDETRNPVGETAANLVAMIPGSDPALAEEVVVITAPLDHLGLEPRPSHGFFQPPRADSIYNGADAGGTGVAMLLEIARWMKSDSNGPKRTVLFVLTAGVPDALGARHFIAQPPVPRERIAAVISVDRLGRGLEGTVDVVGEFSRDSVAGVSLRSVTPDVSSWVCRSDHAVFRHAGLPGLLITSGVDRFIEPLHDSVDQIDLQYLEGIAPAISVLIREITDASTRLLTNTSVPLTCRD